MNAFQSLIFPPDFAHNKVDPISHSIISAQEHANGDTHSVCSDWWLLGLNLYDGSCSISALVRPRGLASPRRSARFSKAWKFYKQQEGTIFRKNISWPNCYRCTFNITEMLETLVSLKVKLPHSSPLLHHQHQAPD